MAGRRAGRTDLWTAGAAVGALTGGEVWGLLPRWWRGCSEQCGSDPDQVSRPTYLTQQEVHVLHAAHPRLQLLRPLLRALFLLLYEPDLVVDGVQLLLEHAGQRLGVRLASWGQQVSEDGLAVISVSVHSNIVAPAVLHVVPSKTVGGPPG